MDISTEAVRMLSMNEVMRARFMASFTPGSTLTREQADEYTVDEIQAMEEVVITLLWEASERRALLAVGDPGTEEYFLSLERKLPEVETKNIDKSTWSKEEVDEVHEGVWAQVVRLVADKGLTNGIEIINLYDSILGQYFDTTVLGAYREMKALEPQGKSKVEISSID